MVDLALPVIVARFHTPAEYVKFVISTLKYLTCPAGIAGTQGTEKLSHMLTLAVVRPATIGVWFVQSLKPQTTRLRASVLSVAISIAVPLTAFLDVER